MAGDQQKCAVDQSAMPIPYAMALTWFLGSLVEVTIAGLILGAIVKA